MYLTSLQWDYATAGDLFESAFHELLSGLPGVTNIADDILDLWLYTRGA